MAGKKAERNLGGEEGRRKERRKIKCESAGQRLQKEVNDIQFLKTSYKYGD